MAITGYDVLQDAKTIKDIKEKLGDMTKIPTQAKDVSGAIIELNNIKQSNLEIERKRKITFGTTTPTGGEDGDIYFQYE